MKIKKLAIATLSMVMLVSALALPASAAEVNREPVAKAEYNVDIENPNMRKEPDFVTESIPGGSWTGGTLYNGGWGTIISYAKSSTRQTNCFAKPGYLASKYWSGWAGYNQESRISKDAESMGNTCGYDYRY